MGATLRPAGRGIPPAQGQDARWAWAQQVAADGGLILAGIAGDPDAAWLMNLPQVNALASIWQQQCVVDTDGVWHVRKECLLAGADRILSPHDPEARWSTKRSTTWEGHKFHTTEGCDDDLPHPCRGADLPASAGGDGGVAATVGTP